MTTPKVAFVEWDTKVPFWKYEGKPSYMYDSARVIDPTAFGANATAMQGSLVGIKPFLDSGHLPDLLQYLNSRDCVFFATRFKWKETLEVVRQITTKKMLGFALTLDEYRGRVQMEDEYESAIELMHEVDMVTSFNEKHVPYLRYFTSTPVEYLPMAYPYSYVKTKRISSKEKDTITLLLPGTVWNGEAGGRRDDIASCAIAHALARGIPHISIALMDRKMHNTNTHPAILPIQLLDKEFGTDIVARTEIYPSMVWSAFLDFAKSFDFSIHWDWIWTTGRMAADMGALGIPHLGGNSDHAEHLFPGLSVSVMDELDLDIAVAKVKDILFSSDKKEGVLNRADVWGKKLDYPEWNRWFVSLFGEL